MPHLERRDLLYLAGLGLLVALFFHKFILFGMVPINADWLHANFQPGRSYVEASAHNGELDDPIYQIYPLRMEAVRQWKEGAVPLWNPKIMCGAPLLADGISKPLDPFIVFYILFGGPAGRSLELLCHFLLMVWGVYILARSLGLSSEGAAVAATVYTFNLLSVTWMEMRTATGVFAFFPWAFLFLETFLEKRKAAWGAAAAIAVGVMILSGHPQFSLYAMAILALLVLWRCVSDWRKDGKRRGIATLLFGAASLAVGIAIAAAEVLPLIELSSNSARGFSQYVRANRAATPLSFLTYVYPDFFGNPIRHDYLGAFVLKRPYMTATAGFVGASTLAFILGGLAGGRSKHKGFFITLLLAAPAFMLAVGAGVFEIIGALEPVSFLGRAVSALDVARLAFVSNFAAAVLAGAGVSMLAAETSATLRRRVAWLVGGFTFALIVLTGLLPMLARPLTFFNELQASSLLWYFESGPGGSGNHLLATAVVVPLCFLAAGAVTAILGWRRTVSAFAASGLVAVELTLFGLGYNPFARAEEIQPAFPFLQAIPREGEPARVLGVDTPLAGDLAASKGDFLVPNTSSLYGLEDVRGDESLRPARYFTYALRIVPPGTPLLASIHFPVYDSPLLDALGARYVMSAVPLAAPHLKTLFADGRAWVYENPRAVPRAYLVGRWWRVDSLIDALNIMQARADFDPRSVAVVETGDELPPWNEGAMQSAQARIVAYHPTRVEIDTRCEGRALLVLADSYYPGWRAFVDGEVKRILPTNGALRGLFLEGGEHHVVFVYAPASFIRGGMLTAASLSACLAILAVSLVARRGGARAGSDL